ncbi:hypothetical protein C900_01770 [Fulvivirga imtechensis AK7]|uniref:Uncharacterized protein n=1 Tax=Fulvivirga imtechensis AK7 TaxID=1237149 RepID=L8JTB1_9BACT|nr:hypothetical protein [Fulvivirga imtechensis]ELR72216.1 hypothetical protein C900_01770 [Fulvivirga imtechensis AK7]
MITLFIGVNAPEATAQEKSKYEKINKKKNKENRRLKRRGDKGKSNNKALRSTKLKIRSKQGERAFKGDITGRKFQTKRSHRPNWGAAVAKPNPYAGRKRTSEGSRAKALKQTPRYSARQREKAWRGGSGRAINTQSKRITFTGKRSYQQRNAQSISRDPERPRKITRIVPRSASGAYRVRKRKNPYVWRERSKWESAYQGDITGRKFRSKRTLERPGIQQPPRVKYTSSGGRRGDRAYDGEIKGGYRSATRTREKAWKNDISGNRLRIRTSEKPKFSGSQFQAYPKGKRRGDKAYKGKIKGGDYRSISSRKERAGTKVRTSKPPGSGTVKAWKFQGNIKSDKPQKGGGSISGKRWNNNGRAIQGRGPRSQDNRIAGFQGNIKGGRTYKGGGSISGKRWNNNGKAIQSRQPRPQDLKVAGFQGRIKGGKKPQGGGSISGKRWNNNGKAIQSRQPRPQDLKVAGFQGKIKGGKIYKGGGSISGRQWNNKGRAIQSRQPRPQDIGIAKFQGNIKAGRSERARDNSRKSGSYKGKIPAYMLQKGPNDEHKFTGNLRKRRGYVKNPSSAKEALKVKDMNRDYRRNANYRGKLPAYMSKKGLDDEHQFRGRIKQPKYKKSPYAVDEALKSRKPGKNEKLSATFKGFNKRGFKYKKNKSADDESLMVKKPGKNYFKGGEYQGNIKVTSKYKKSPYSADESLKARAPGKNEKLSANFQGFNKRGFRYTKNKSASDEALKVRPPGKNYLEGGKYQGNVKMTWKYSKKPNAAEGAMKGIGPSRAAIQASNYQGNIKMKRKNVADRHPDFKYLSKSSSGKSEKDKTFSFKLFWSKLFKKEENQPDHLKEKERKPRYDKREQGIWYD